MEYLGEDKAVNKITPLVSVRVATYNHGKYIAQCLDSILMQKTNFPFEILIGEDASSDDTREICKKYADKHPDKIRLFLRKKEEKFYINGKPTGKTNIMKTRNAARGKYAALCDGDDYWTDPKKLQKQAEFLEENPDYILTFQDARIVDEKGHFLSEGGLPARLKTDGTGIDLIGGKWLPTLTVMYRNIIPKEMPDGYYKVLNGDAYVYTLLGHHGGAKYIAGLTPCHYRKHAGGIWSALSQKERYTQAINTRKMVLECVEERYRWAVYKLIFEQTVLLATQEDGLFPKIKTYLTAYKYFVFRLGFIKMYLNLHLSLAKKVAGKIKSRLSRILTRSPRKLSVS